MNRSIKWLLAVVAAVAVVLFVTILFKGERTEPPLPVPNGYDDFVAAIPLIVPSAGYWSTQDVAELRSIVEQNSNALTRIRAALGKSWQIPVGVDSNFVTGLMTNLMNMRMAAQIYCAEGRLAEL